MNNNFNKIIDNFFDKKPKLHFIGIGGAGMSALAGICLQSGYSVSGSDICAGEYTNALKEGGAKINFCHSAKNIADCDIVVFSSAIKPDNRELLQAIKLNKCVLERHKFLSIIFNCFEQSFAVAGSHGKTTVCGMLSQILIEADADPQVLIGGNFPYIKGNYRKGGGCIVAEACEYKRNFLSLKSKVAILLNTDNDHMDYYKSAEDVIDAYSQFVSNVKDGGCCVINGEDKGGIKIKKGIKVITYGMENTCTVQAANIKSVRGRYSFDIIDTERGGNINIKLSVLGRHNIYNALAAYSAATAMGINQNQAAKSLKAFKGTKRRLEYMGRLNKAAVISDYAHHPSEIKATIDCVREIYPKGKIITVFQPHTYTRTKSFMDKFAASFNRCDKVLLLPVYAAREKYDKAGSSIALYENIKKNFYNIIYLDSFKQARDYLCQINCSCILIMGAGDIHKLCGMLDISV